MSERVRNILTGLIATILSVGVITVGIQVANGAYRAEYELVGTFSSAGQGLLPGSDVKVRGVNIGEVSSIRLADGRARIALSIDESERVPTTATATIRAKTLFGEKFVDIEPGAGEGSGPYLSDGDTLTDTIGAFELQQVLNEAFPILDEIDPTELAVVLSTLAEGGRDLGPTINSQIERARRILEVSARHDDDTDQFLSDLARLSDALAGSADDIVAGARDLGFVLPEINERGDRLAVLLTQVSRLSADLADILDANRSFLETNIVEGGKALDLLSEHRGQIQPLVVGIRQFLESLASTIRIPLEDGTRLAAVKFVAGGDPFGQTDPPLPVTTGAGGRAGAPGPGAPDGVDLWSLLPPMEGTAAIQSLLGGVLP